MTPTQPETALDRARETYNGLFGDPEERDAALVFSISLARVLTAEGTVNRLARLIDQEAFVYGSVVFGYLTEDRTQATALATSILTLLAEMAEVG